MTKNEIKKQMDAVPLFHGISIEEMHCVYRRIRKNLIANEVDSGREHVGIILSGSMDVYSVLPDDTEVRLSKLQAGDLFGICNLFSSYDRETILKCRSDCDVAFVPKEEFRHLLMSNEELMTRYLRLCNDKIAFLLRRTENLAMQSCRGKVIRYLLLNATGSSGETVVLKDSKEIWAKSLGISRAALYRELADLREKGMIRIKGRQITLLKRELLENIGCGRSSLLLEREL
ncbi:Crp/Fnr family transcriptional regulator [[Clostridium] aminophilum]|uniref:Crp/Fnr family transcriptional regulator n=1 Tax=[Clostridium] aminophilum TaxID=1526 RepID=UPI00331E91D4